jgi:predicted RNase H-like nuclease (RuvC/YqgF family)
MSANPLDEATALRIRRLELDNDDLRAENARLKGSILQKQDEIIALGERLGQLKARLDKVHRMAAWSRLRKLNPMRAILRRMG